MGKGGSGLLASVNRVDASDGQISSIKGLSVTELDRKLLIKNLRIYWANPSFCKTTYNILRKHSL